MIGRVLASRFAILTRIGSGSMGTVYRARQQSIGRNVAIKILRTDRAVNEANRARFVREARVQSLLKSPHTVTVFDFGQCETGHWYLAMELLEGESLGRRLRRLGRIAPADALETARQTLHSLADAHARGIIHRDLKPDNIFYARVRPHACGEPHGEIVKVLDFGIAKMLSPDLTQAIDDAETLAGTVFGTPRYMSPEQVRGWPLDARSDLYSLGVILYQMLTGYPPFVEDDSLLVMARHVKTVPRSMGEVAPDAHIPANVERVVMRMLAKDPDARYPTADALLAELDLAPATPCPRASSPETEPVASSCVSRFGPRFLRNWVASPRSAWHVFVCAVFMGASATGGILGPAAIQPHRAEASSLSAAAAASSENLGRLGLPGVVVSDSTRRDTPGFTDDLYRRGPIRRHRREAPGNSPVTAPRRRPAVE